MNDTNPSDGPLEERMGELRQMLSDHDHDEEVESLTTEQEQRLYAWHAAHTSLGHESVVEDKLLVAHWIVTGELLRELVWRFNSPVARAVETLHVDRCQRCAHFSDEHQGADSSCSLCNCEEFVS